jgi:putative ABC transport system permease protein
MEHARTVDALGAFGAYEYSVMFADNSARLFGTEVSPAILAVLGARPIIGRLFTETEANDGAAPVAIISESLWRERYSGNPDVVTRSLIVDGRAHAIIGVLDVE